MTPGSFCTPGHFLAYSGVPLIDSASLSLVGHLVPIDLTDLTLHILVSMTLSENFISTCDLNVRLHD